VIGKVDDRNRALIDLEVRQTPNSQGTSVTAWIAISIGLENWSRSK
jgi:hypothetical protein